MYSDRGYARGAVLELRDLGVARGGRTLFSGLQLKLTAGQLAVVVGPNGSGKTSLLRTIAGFNAPERGRVDFNGESMQQLVRENRAPIIYYSHLDGLKRDLTVFENVLFAGRLLGSHSSPERALEDIGLCSAMGRRVRHLSAGQRRRAALARLDLAPAQVWLLDEPFTNLDGDGRSLVIERIRRQLAQFGIVVVATHQATELESIPQLRIEF
jgi:heme exporter protein A